MKVCSKCSSEISTRDGDNTCPNCKKGKTRNTRRSRREIDDVMASLGLVRVKGAMGGTYYE